MTDDWKKKFPIGSRWETRAGNRVIIVEHDDSLKERPLIVWHSRCYGVAYHTTEGRFGLSVANDLADLVSPWVERQQGVIWINAYGSGEFSAHSQ